MERAGSVVIAFTEDDLLPLSALQHLVFCERQCALIHIEQVWRDNPLTVEGSHLHDRTHESAPRRELRADLLIARGLPLRSFRLGVSGIADAVEFHRFARSPETAGSPEALAPAVSLLGLLGAWRPFPVEYKHGKPKPDVCDEVQVCAQAMCLEEMLGVAVPEGALFYGAIQRRRDVRFEPKLRAATESAAQRLHELITGGTTPRAKREPKCKRCSLLDLCRPEAMSLRKSARRFLVDAVERTLHDEVTER